MHHIMYGSPYKVRRRFLLSYLLPATLYPNQDSYMVLSVRLSVTPHTNSPPPPKKSHSLTSLALLPDPAHEAKPPGLYEVHSFPPFRCVYSMTPVLYCTLRCRASKAFFLQCANTTTTTSSLYLCGSLGYLSHRNVGKMYVCVCPMLLPT